jgi:hypothetical protein
MLFAHFPGENTFTHDQFQDANMKVTEHRFRARYKVGHHSVTFSSYRYNRQKWPQGQKEK